MVRKLVRIHARAVDYIYANRDDAMRIYAKVWNAKPDQVAKYFPKYFTYEGEWSRGGFEKAALDKMSEGLQLVGDVDKPVDWSKVIDQQFLPKEQQKPL
jgi:NitT/TauT family transport system substrate-binding protein